MWKKKNSLLNRAVSGAMGIIMTAISAFSPLTTLPVYAGESLIDMDYRQVESDEVEIHVESEGMSFEPRSEVEFKVFVQNNTDKTLVNGSLSWRDDNDVLEDKEFLLQDEEEEDVNPESDTDADSKAVINEEGIVTNITLEPDEVYEVGFTATVDESLELFSKREIGFFFGGFDAEYPEDNEKVETKSSNFEFTAGLVTLLPVEHEDENKEVAVGSTGSMTLSLVFDTSEYSYEMTKENLTTETATDSNGEEEPATATDSNGDEEPVTATDSNGEEDAVTATGSNGEENTVTATDSNGEEDAVTATGSNGNKEEDDSEDDEYLLELNKISYDISTYNVKFSDFEIVDAQLTEGGDCVIANIEYEVDEETELGTYFGRIDAVVNLDGKKFYATQGFDVTVVEAENALTAEQQKKLEQELQKVLDMIAKLPTMDEYFAATEKFFFDDDTMDEEGFDAYIYELAQSVIPAFEAYQALSDEQKAMIPEEDYAKLDFLYSLCSASTMELSGDGWNSEFEKSTFKVTFSSTHYGADDGNGSGKTVPFEDGKSHLISTLYIVLVDENGNRLKADNDASGNDVYYDEKINYTYEFSYAEDTSGDKLAGSKNAAEISTLKALDAIYKNLNSSYSLLESDFIQAYIKGSDGNKKPISVVDWDNWYYNGSGDRQYVYGWQYRVENDSTYYLFDNFTNETTGIIEAPDGNEELGSHGMSTTAVVYFEYAMRGPQEGPNPDLAVEENTEIHLFNYGSFINESFVNNGNPLLGFANDESVDKTEGGTPDSPVYRNKAALDVTTTKGAASKPKMKPTLDSDGYPVITKKNINDEAEAEMTNGASLKYLFDEGMGYISGGQANSAETYDPTAPGGNNYVSKHFAVKNDGEGTGLFWRDTNGYLVFDSALHRATYNQTTKKFDLYDYAVRPYWGSENLRGQGHFLPFNYDLSHATQVIEDGVISSDEAVLKAAHLGVNPKGTPEDTADDVSFKDVMIEYVGKHPTLATIAKDLWVLPDTATDKTGTFGEEEYPYWSVPDNMRKSTADYYYGMSIEFDFFMPEDGEIDGEPMVFDFLGDDDVWVYIDDVLVLNIGGGHNPMIGYIDFSTGETWQPKETDITSSDENLVEKTLREIYKDSGKYSDAELSEIFGENGNTFVDFSSHRLKFFYMERGSGSANCRLKFNMPTLPPNSLTITKEVEDEGGYTDNETSYGFKVWKADENENKSETLAITEGMEFDIWKNGVDTNVNGKVGAGGVITLTKGQSAVFSNMMYKADEACGYKYFVEEIGDLNNYSVSYKVGSQNVVEGNCSGVLTSTEVQYITFTNSVKPGDFSLTKNVSRSDNKEDQSGEFHFDIEIPRDIAGFYDYQYGDETRQIEFVPVASGSNAVASITLSHDQPYTIYDLPAGAQVTVTETNSDGFDVTWSGDVNGKGNSITGTIPCGGEADQVFDLICHNNDIEGDLVIKKQVENTETKESFEFQIKLATESNATYDYVIKNSSKEIQSGQIRFISTPSNGTASATIELEHDQSCEILGLPIVGVTVTELTTDGYLVHWTDGDGNGTNDISVTDGGASAGSVIRTNEPLVFECTNEYLTDVAITKNVTANLGDRSQLFNFTAVVTTKDSAGTATEKPVTFQLKHGETKTIEDVKIGTKVTVTEAEVADYEASYVIGSGPKQERRDAVVNELPHAGVTITFTNHKEATIDTGILLDSAPYLATLAIAFGGMALYVVSRRKKEEDDME